MGGSDSAAGGPGSDEQAYWDRADEAMDTAEARDDVRQEGERLSGSLTDGLDPEDRSDTW